MRNLAMFPRQSNYRRRIPLVVCLLAAAAGLSNTAAAQPLPKATSEFFGQYCIECHGTDLAEARIDLARMTADLDFGRQFKDWEQVVRMLKSGKMPPPDARQPGTDTRNDIAASIESALKDYIAQHAGDPGPVVLRRLTSAEYGYTIQDLTGLHLDLHRSFVSDAVGGEGFTNVGNAQFMQDSTLEQYLTAAKTIADHAVIGAGPLGFFEHPGKSGLELSAIARINGIYRRHGFRTAAGEGAEPFGLDLYPRSLHVAWQYKHRQMLGSENASIEQLAVREHLSPALCRHVWQVVSRPAVSFPLSAIVSPWQDLPPPSKDDTRSAEARAQCNELGASLRQWQRVLAASAGDEEEAAVLTEGTVRLRSKHTIEADLNWPDDATAAEIEISVTSACQQGADGALTIWRQPRVRFVRADRRRGEIQPLVPLLSAKTVEQLQPGQHPQGAAIGKMDFIVPGGATVPVRIEVPAGSIAARLFVDVELDTLHGADRIVRCRISDGAVSGETAAEVGDTSTLLGNPEGEIAADWHAGVAEFARLLPEVSHREPAPSDRDPIPGLFDNTYNMPERNHFHYAIKYHRDDRFLVEHILDDATRRSLDEAWTDLLMSFDYHHAWLQSLAKKYSVALPGGSLEDLSPELLEKFPAQARDALRRLRDERAAMEKSLRAAEPGHIDDALQFAQQAWRRPVENQERKQLRVFYAQLRGTGLDHAAALRTLLVRVLVAPAFLYRAETLDVEADTSTALAKKSHVPLSDYALASRLSYFLWSSPPDQELLQAAAAGKLQNPGELAGQARRMLVDPKARRLAEEFFGQWLGFYRFDDYRGIDGSRFPELTDSLKAAMHDEAVSFFEHIVREDRPPAEILFAEYTFLNAPLAEHYGLDATELPAAEHVRVESLARQHRGGLFGMAAVLATTSAPLRTSAVKRGDWVLRRLIGTPVPPPPADAGSIPAEDALADGLTVRQRLEAHRTDRSCVNCHARIDPLGFALEHYDPIGRWRESYRDGRPIDDSGKLADGTQIEGLDGLYDWLRREQPQFERNLCGKLLGFALGRAEMASDRPLIEEMQTALKDNGRFSDLIVPIVTSQQFRHRLR
jgi:hypothetical protein